jgi:hypothetical protein
MRIFNCGNCGNVVHFENSQCQLCLAAIGYSPRTTSMIALSNGAGGEAASPPAPWRLCQNSQHGVCNWLLPAESTEALCRACRHNKTIPDISVPANIEAWRKIELAKRRLFYSLARFNLPDEPPENGGERLIFDFLGDGAGIEATRVVTGHQNGLVTLSLAEADDVERERRRASLNEPYRTLLGHFRHEVGHYYWDALVRDGGGVGWFREVFGDESIDYGEALRRYYANGPATNWALNHVSAYASAHPWEDFAESWAHYFHIVDTVETAAAFGLTMGPDVDWPGKLRAVADFDPYVQGDFGRIVEVWVPLTIAMNSLSRSMGVVDAYPFALGDGALRKLRYIHDLVWLSGRIGSIAA